MTTKQFHLRTILTIATGRLLTKPQGERDNGIGDLYEILGWMTDDSPFTHQLGRFAEECKPWLLRWFPDLQAVGDSVVQQLDERSDKVGFEKLIAAIIPDEIRDVPKIPRDDHVVKNPIDELVEMRGTDEGIVTFQSNQ
jgi:hypothetical protein